ncbi:RteC domain-containing protein [Sphingobacterium siyangense]|uniref:RteC domain-containing protein n=1 Tax=Sphingobacterium siyangense TaxID=459529 RepID=UPI002FDF06AA
MKQEYKNILLSIEKEERSLSNSNKSVYIEACRMVTFLRNLLRDLKVKFITCGFESSLDEITFFKEVKPKVLSKFIYYSKVVSIESFSPGNGPMLKKYLTEQIKFLKKEYVKHIGCKDFYQYFKSGRTDRDDTYFRLGHVNFLDCTDNFLFEMDLEFSTFYDYKIARILAFDLIHDYLSKCLNPDRANPIYDEKIAKSAFSWTHSKNALIELIYALHVSGCLSHGRGSLKKLGILFEELFEIDLGDIHHAFHQMKFRAGEKASFLFFLKNALEQYMEKDL